MDTDGQSSAFAAGAGLKARGNDIYFIYDAPCGTKKLLTFYGRSTSAIRALEERGA
jgi:hypothetical protein